MQAIVRTCFTLNSRKRCARVTTSHQNGFALIFALVLLLVITVIGIGAMRGTTIAQKVMANFYDREIAFQSAEAALQAGAQALGAGTAVIARNCGQGGTACTSNPFTETPAVAGVQTVAAGSGTALFSSLVNATGQPQYIIENMGAWPDPNSDTGFAQTANAAQYGAQGVSTTSIYYRISARSGDPSVVGDRAVVTLQAMYKQ